MTVEVEIPIDVAVAVSLRPKLLHSNLTQWKRAGLITLKSLDRNQELLLVEKLSLFVSIID